MTPHIASLPSGEVVFEWQQSQKTLAVYVNATGDIDFVRTWGKSVTSEMDDGKVGAISADQLWQWLLNERLPPAPLLLTPAVFTELVVKGQEMRKEYEKASAPMRFLTPEDWNRR